VALRAEPLEERLDPDGKLFPPVADAQVDRPALDFAIADHGHVGHLLQLSRADLRLHALGPGVDLDAEVAVVVEIVAETPVALTIP